MKWNVNIPNTEFFQKNVKRKLNTS